MEKAAGYGKTSFELVKLQVVDKTSDGVSSFIPFILVIASLSSFLFFVNLGAAFWLGEILGRTYFGFFAVAGFYALLAFVLRFIMHKRIKRNLYDYIIRQLLQSSSTND